MAWEQLQISASVFIDILAFNAYAFNCACALKKEAQREMEIEVKLARCDKKSWQQREAEVSQF